MKISRTTLLITGILALTAFALLMSQRSGTLYDKENQFAVADTASITKIFFADKSNNTVTLARLSDGSWSINDTFSANKETVNTILKTFVNLDVKMPVAKAAHNNIMKLLAAKSVKTEIYQRVYRINLFGKIKLFPHVKRTKTYYVGDATMDNRGTFMIMEGSENPYIVYIPGFRGFVSTRYTARLNDWRDHSVFNLKLPEIASVSVEYGQFPASSFSILNNNDRHFTVSTLQGIPVKYDTLKVINYLGSFNRISFESMVEDLSSAQIDSVKATTPFAIVKVVSRSGKTSVIKAWRKKANAGDTDINNNPMKYDADRLYGFIEATGDFVTLQFFVFDKIFRPIEWITGTMTHPDKLQE